MNQGPRNTADIIAPRQATPKEAFTSQPLENTLSSARPSNEVYISDKKDSEITESQESTEQDEKKTYRKRLFGALGLAIMSVSIASSLYLKNFGGHREENMPTPTQNEQTISTNEIIEQKEIVTESPDKHENGNILSVGFQEIYKANPNISPEDAVAKVLDNIKRDRYALSFVGNTMQEMVGIDGNYANPNEMFDEQGRQTPKAEKMSDFLGNLLVEHKTINGWKVDSMEKTQIPTGTHLTSYFDKDGMPHWTSVRANENDVIKINFEVTMPNGTIEHHDALIQFLCANPIIEKTEIQKYSHVADHKEKDDDKDEKIEQKNPNLSYENNTNIAPSKKDKDKDDKDKDDNKTTNNNTASSNNSTGKQNNPEEEAKNKRDSVKQEKNEKVEEHKEEKDESIKVEEKKDSTKVEKNNEF